MIMTDILVVLLICALAVVPACLAWRLTTVTVRYHE